MPPSPVLCRAPVIAQPRLIASTAGPDRDPTLIALTLTAEVGRNGFARPRAAPSTLAQGMTTFSPAWGRTGGDTAANVACLMTGAPSRNSTSLSVPKPKYGFSCLAEA